MDIKNLEDILKKNNQPAFRLGQIKKAIFQDGISSFSEISTLSKDFREKLKEEINILSFEVVNVLEAKDGQSIKALLRTDDGNLIETVLISPKPGFWSTCISCQVGCQMGCRFCATGAMGFKRDLSAEEITDQVLFWKQYLTKNLKPKTQNLKPMISNIVYMGMGEPFNNWKNVSESIRILTGKDLFGFGSRSLSVSTSGIAEGVLKLAEEFPQVNLAISLHFADDEKRSHYMPANKKDNLESLRKSLQKYFQKTKRKVFIEYILLENINDSRKDAENLAAYLKSVGNAHLLHVNLIRYNTVSVILDLIRNPDGEILNQVQDDTVLKPSSKTRTQAFKEMLETNNINATIRKSLGEEIKGACGQLAAHRE